MLIKARERDERPDHRHTTRALLYRLRRRLTAMDPTGPNVWWIDAKWGGKGSEGFYHQSSASNKANGLPTLFLSFPLFLIFIHFLLVPLLVSDFFFLRRQTRPRSRTRLHLSILLLLLSVMSCDDPSL